MSSSVSTHSVFAVVTTDLFPLKICLKFGGQDARNSVGNVSTFYLIGNIFNKCILFDCKLLRSVFLDLPLIPEEDIYFSLAPSTLKYPTSDIDQCCWS